jgi:hypothetical protein
MCKYRVSLQNVSVGMEGFRTHVGSVASILFVWVQGSLGGASAPPFHKHSSVQKLKEAVIDNMKKVVGTPIVQQESKDEDEDDCQACKPGESACADHVEPLLPELLRRQDKAQDHARIKEELHTAAMAYVPISHLMWGLWGLIQAKTSNCDYDFVEYGRQRLDQYHITKPDMSDI